MNFEDLTNLTEKGAVINEEKKRVELAVTLPDGSKSRIAGYFPSKNIQVIAYDIHKRDMPDINFEKSGMGRYLRVNCCKSGRCELKRKDGKSAYISSGEVSMDYYIDDDGTFSLTADYYVGVEIIMQVDNVITEIPTLAMLKKAIKRMDLPDYATNINSLYFVESSEDTRNTLDRLLKYCFSDYDCEAIIIKIAELGHNIGTDLTTSSPNVHTFVTPAQAHIAEDVHRSLSERYGEKWTADIFAKKYNLSASTIKNYFRNVYGCGFKEYQVKIRMTKAAELLRDTKTEVKEIALKVGYHSRAKFGEAFNNYYGVTPFEYRCNASIERAESSS
ncbi:MAG: helix-turn-helix transcriptional regulator [Ruminococcus sp.]|nr:helix-turn-helix transcriptional regulator [Ruminococcus sp.]